MKLKEKLAYANRPSFCCSNCKCDCRVQMDAFLAGFRAAKSLALSAVYDSDGDPTGHIARILQELGEEEEEVK